MSAAGGRARAASLSPERRHEIAVDAAKRRWGNREKRDQMEEPTKQEPKGVVAILSGPDGYVWATADDFKDYGPDERRRREAQTLRAQSALAFNLIVATCNGNVAEVIPKMVCEDIVNALIRKKGWRRTIKYIGYKEGSDQ